MVGRQDGTYFKGDPPEGCPGPVSVTRSFDDGERRLWENLITAERLHRDRNVVCALLQATPPKERAAREERRRRRVAIVRN